jgi:hypothetical protein
MNWYMDVLNLKPTDAIFDPKTGEEITCFAHIDLGPQYTDYHVSNMNFKMLAEMVLLLAKRLMTAHNLSRLSLPLPQRLQLQHILIIAALKSMILTRRHWAMIGSQKRDGRTAGVLGHMFLAAKYLTIGNAASSSFSCAADAVPIVFRYC